MITKVELFNFQSHRYSLFEFTQGVNAIIGQSDAGKSAILRGVRWVLTNKPSGDDFRSSFTSDDCKVVIELADGNVIERAKGKTVNHYKLNDTVYTAMGQAVPEPIQLILNMNELNCMAQLDNVFLLSNTPGQIAQQLNEMSSLSIIDSIQKLAISHIKELNNKYTHTQAQLDEVTQSLGTLSYVDELTEKVSSLSRVHDDLTSTSSTCTQMYNALVVAQRAKFEFDSLKTYPDENEINEILTLFTQFQEKSEVCDKYATQITITAQFQDSLTTLPPPPTEQEIRDVLTHVKQLEEIRMKKITLASTIKKVSSYVTDIQYATGLLDSAITELKNNCPDVCPLCGMTGGTYDS